MYNQNIDASPEL